MPNRESASASACFALTPLTRVTGTCSRGGAYRRRGLRSLMGSFCGPAGHPGMGPAPNGNWYDHLHVSHL